MSIQFEEDYETDIGGNGWRDIPLDKKPAAEAGGSHKIDLPNRGGEEEEAEEEPVKQPVQQQAQPQIQYVQPQIDTRALARDIVQMQQPQVDPFQDHVKQLLDGGAEAQGVTNLLKLLDLRDQRRNQAMSQQSQKEAYDKHINEVWAMFTTKLDDVEEKVPQFSKLRPSLEQDVFNTFRTDPEFANDFIAVGQGKKPSAKSVSKAVAKVVDAYHKDLGIARPAAPVSMQSSRPAPNTGRSTAGGVGNLDDRQMKYFNTFKDPSMKPSELAALAQRARKAYPS